MSGSGDSAPSHRGYATKMVLDGESVHRLLDEELDTLHATLDALSADVTAEETGAADELSTADQHPADMATEVHDLSRDLGLRTDIRRRIAENRAARERLEDGRYGTCEHCGRPIDDERLRAVPSTRYCAHDEAQADQPLTSRPGSSST